MELESTTCDIHKHHAIHEKLGQGRMMEERQGNHVPSAFYQRLCHVHAGIRIPYEWSRQLCRVFLLYHGSSCTTRDDVANRAQHRVTERWQRTGTKRSWNTSFGTPGDFRSAFLARMQFERGAKRSFRVNSTITAHFGLTVEQGVNP